jgi:hypothetical protein
MPIQESLEPPSELRLRPGEATRFRLRGAGSAGYQWTWTIDGDADAISVAVEAASLPPTPVSGVLHGGSVDQIIAVRALRAGTARLHLVLARPVKANVSPLASHKVAITISSEARPPDTA